MYFRCSWILFTWSFTLLLVSTHFYSVVNADLVVYPTGSSTTLLDGNPFDPDNTVTINGSGAFSGCFYGNSVGQISVAENGNLNFSNNRAYFPSALSDTMNGDYVARIAPLWDDVALLDVLLGNRVVDHSVAGSYLAITWENVVMFNDLPAGPILTDPPSQTFQVIWFEQAQTIRGFDFLKDDIAFGYQGSVPGTNSFGTLYSTIGITNGLGRYTSLPGDSDGFITSDATNPTEPDQSSLLAYQADHFLLFRPKVNPTEGYNSSVEVFTAVPEPSSLCILTIIFLIVLVCKIYLPIELSKSETVNC